MSEPLTWNEAERVWEFPDPESCFKIEAYPRQISIGNWCDGEGIFVSHDITDRDVARQVAALLLKWAETGSVAP